MKETVMVTVIMLTYNHEKWIAKALDGVVQQKTNFKFKLFVHDDCSADNTAKIIEHYHKKYPLYHHQPNKASNDQNQSVQKHYSYHDSVLVELANGMLTVIECAVPFSS